MIAWAKIHQRSAIICGLTLLLPFLVYCKLLGAAWGLRAEAAGAIDNLGPRIARMQGVLQVQDQLTTLARDAQQLRGQLVYPATADRNTAAASLQSSLRQLMSEAGLSISDSQVLPVREEEKFDYIGIRLTVSGDMASLDRALVALADFKPLVMVEALTAWPTRQRRQRGDAETQEVTVSLRLLSLRSVL
ncbi:hypothetical protein E4634_08180 [Mangrovimicrobium sediminis]|uniref:General secretion pathway protein GspM n=1 Tax=Mangrovimicrobium sediminis TaxID=2562682 RepID=A0A4Z0M3B2_9GAMM|nr:type II secretion system protein GspM [Haliea sp. SAOS-164]TGD74102.1 hypothetical protein E4634_08180 [Haliea sp. SAOS-164]